MSRGRKSRNGEDKVLYLVAIMMLAVFALPLVGMYLLLKGETEGEKAFGATLGVVGIILWILIAVN